MMLTCVMYEYPNNTYAPSIVFILFIYVVSLLFSITFLRSSVSCNACTCRSILYNRPIVELFFVLLPNMVDVGIGFHTAIILSAVFDF